MLKSTNLAKYCCALEEEPFHFPIVSGYEYKNFPQFQNGRFSTLLPRPLASAKDWTPQKSNTAFLKISKSLWAVAENGKRDFSLWINIFLLPSVKKTHKHSHILVISDIALMDLMRLCHYGHYGRNRRNRGWKNGSWPKVTENRTTLSQQGSTMTSWSRNIIYYVITVVQNNKDIMKITVYGELNIFSRFMENNHAKSRFTATMEIEEK